MFVGGELGRGALLVCLGGVVCLCAPRAEAVEPSHVVRLTNNRELQGSLLSPVPDDTLTLRLGDLSVVRYPWAEVERVVVLEERSRTKAVGLAVAGGLVIDGAGQWYNGEKKKAAMLAGLDLVCLALAVSALGEDNPEDRQSGGNSDNGGRLALASILRMCVYVWSVIDAYDNGGEIRERDLFDRKSERPGPGP